MRLWSALINNRASTVMGTFLQLCIPNVITEIEQVITTSSTPCKYNLPLSFLLMLYHTSKGQPVFFITLVFTKSYLGAFVCRGKSRDTGN